MSVNKGFTFIEMLISLLIASLLCIMMNTLSSASLSVFTKSYLIESHLSAMNALLFSVRQELSDAIRDKENILLYIESNKSGVIDSCIRFSYQHGKEIKRGGFRLDSKTHRLERYSGHGDNWSCDSGYWQDLHDERFQVDTLLFNYKAPVLLMYLKVQDKSMKKKEDFYVSAYIKN